MEHCQYGNCQKEGTIIGFVIAKEDSNPNNYKEIKVLACEKHSKKSSFFKLGKITD